MFGEASQWPDQDLVGWSDSLDINMTLLAYQQGLFPMPLEDAEVSGIIGWFSPIDRGILPINRLRVTKSLRKSCRRYRVSVDAAFVDVMKACGDPSRPDGWIDDDIIDTYKSLYENGIAHSVEVWDVGNQLVGGLYGVSIAGLFAGESMFHTAAGRDASKVALVGLCQILGDAPRLLDVQWLTPHLESLGAIEISRDAYLDLLDDARDCLAPDWQYWRDNPPNLQKL
ncbi:MAG: leucyl/phenylalanyl-tRNA--protein transferase [Propionibacteriaceae bacterium]